MGEVQARSHNRPGGRTIFISVTGFGAAALVTSIPAMSLDAGPLPLAVATVGGTAILATAAAVTVLCALRVKQDRIAWLLAGLALAATQAGSGIRSGALLTGSGGNVGGIAEGMYAAGIVMLGAALLLWPWSRRKRMRIALPIIESAVLVAVLGAGFWLFAGSRLVQTAYVSGSIEPVLMQQFLGLLLLVSACAVFSFACVAHLLGTEPLLPWALASAALLSIAAGDLAWLWSMTGPGWQPGALSDFVHIAGHVTIAVAASLAIDNERTATNSSSTGVSATLSAQ